MEPSTAPPLLAAVPPTRRHFRQTRFLELLLAPAFARFRLSSSPLLPLLLLLRLLAEAGGSGGGGGGG